MNARLGMLGTAVLALAAVAVTQAQDGEAPASLGRLAPRPAEIAPLAARSLLLGIERVGTGLVAVGDRGTILHRADAKAEFRQVPSPVHATLTAVAFGDAKRGWAVGHDGAILRSVDGGLTWAMQRYAPAENRALMSLVALDGERAIAVGAYGLMLATADGGKTWTEVEAPVLREEGLHLNAIARLGNGSLFVVGEMGLAGVSADGIAWQKVSLPYEGSLFGIVPLTAGGALVYGLRGNVLRSADVRAGGWTAVDIGSQLSMYGGTRLADGTIVLVGADGEYVNLDPAGGVQRGQIPAQAGSLTGGSLSAVVPWEQGVMMIGEAGSVALSWGAEKAAPKKP